MYYKYGKVLNSCSDIREFWKIVRLFGYLRGIWGGQYLGERQVSGDIA